MERTPPLLHRIQAAAERIGCGKTTLYELLKGGDIVAIKIGTKTLIPESSLAAFVHKRVAEGQVAV